MKPLCVIPARGGSKRLARKNLLPLAGKPMLAHTVAAALETGLFDQVVVTTEDVDIAEAARKYGAEVHVRPPALAGDLVSGTEVCIELYESKMRNGIPYDAIVCLQPTSPLRLPEEICGAWEHFCSSGVDYLVSVTPVDPHYFHWAVHQQDGRWKMYFGDQYLMERPLLPPVYRPNGSIKIAKADALQRRRDFFGPCLEVFETPEETSVHVATQFDFDLAEHLLTKRESSRRDSRGRA